MKIVHLDINNFRGISEADIFFDGHSVIIGDNNAGKSTIIEAIDLVLGPDRLGRIPVIDEHDFFNGNYSSESDEKPCVEIELIITDLSEDQIARFKANLEFWDTQTGILLPPGSLEGVDHPHVKEALRVKFVGGYNLDEDDFEGDTYFCSPTMENGIQPRFSKFDKRECGFLYLRTLRTGARALSMERGSLLDIILRLREIRPKMWEGILTQLRETTVAAADAEGLNEVLESVQNALKEFVPIDWGTKPHLKVSDLTREHLRKTLTIFMSTGNGDYSAPFQHQGTGTINTMVLALLSMIAEAKSSVIFAMEEPEIAIPPYTQKRIVDSIRQKASQALFTSHSPFVLEEFSPSNIILVQRDIAGVVLSQTVDFPAMIKPKSYNAEFRLRFSEALLAKKVLITEGATEALSYAAAGRKLNELNKDEFVSLEALGVAVFDAKTETAIPAFGEYFSKLGKTVFAVFDKQEAANLKKIQENVAHAFESPYKGFEDLLLAETDSIVLTAFYNELVDGGNWPTHLDKHKPKDITDIDSLQSALFEYLKWSKGDLSAPELIGMATQVDQLPISVRAVLKKIKEIVEIVPEPAEEIAE